MVNTFMAGFVGSPAMNQTPRYRAQGGLEVLEMERFWHAHTMWHDPSGIGTGRGIKGLLRLAPKSVSERDAGSGVICGRSHLRFLWRQGICRCQGAAEYVSDHALSGLVEPCVND